MERFIFTEVVNSHQQPIAEDQARSRRWPISSTEVRVGDDLQGLCGCDLSGSSSAWGPSYCSIRLPSS